MGQVGGMELGSRALTMNQLSKLMSQSTAISSFGPATAESSRVRMISRILRLTDGEPAYTAQIRTMLWSEYCDAGAPLGRTEEGMLVWWDRRMSD